MISGILLDLSGVLYESDHVIPRAADAVTRLRDAGLPMRFVTNTTRSTKQALCARLTRIGLPIAVGEIFSPSGAACAWLEAHACTPHLLVHPALREEFSDVSVGDASARAVVVGDAADGFSYGALNAAFRALMDGAEFIALAENRYFKDEDARLSLDAGPFVKALAFACGRDPVIMGKPSRAFYDLALASIDCPRQEAVMVGDDVAADVSGALAAGVGHALLVRTGKYRTGDEFCSPPRPSAVVDDVWDAATWVLERRAAQA